MPIDLSHRITVRLSPGVYVRLETVQPARGCIGMRAAVSIGISKLARHRATVLETRAASLPPSR